MVCYNRNAFDLGGKVYHQGRCICLMIPQDFFSILRLIFSAHFSYRLEHIGFFAGEFFLWPAFSVFNLLMISSWFV